MFLFKTIERLTEMDPEEHEDLLKGGGGDANTISSRIFGRRGRPQAENSTGCSSSVFWKVLCGGFAASTLVLAVQLSRQQQQLDAGRDYGRGFVTDLNAVRPALDVVQVAFTGALKIHGANGSWYRDLEPGHPQYVGPPSKDIDDAWDELMKGLNIDLEGPHADDVRGKTYSWPGTDRHLTGVSAYHALHCVNMVRKAVYREHYPYPEEPDAAEFTRIHVDHCIDYLRQSLQCSADLTPMLWHWSRERDIPVLDATETHTCRRWEAIHEWAARRRLSPGERDLTASGRHKHNKQQAGTET